MSHKGCCIKSCKNTGKSKVIFYRFPIAARKKDQRERWINIVKKVNNFVPEWEPKEYTLICSAHFIGNMKSEHPLSPSYVPSIFSNLTPSQQSLKIAALKRHERFMERRRQAAYPNVVSAQPLSTCFLEDHNYVMKKCDPKDAAKRLKFVPNIVRKSKPLAERRYNNQERSATIPNVQIDTIEVVVPFKTEPHIPEYKSQGCQAYVPIKPGPPFNTFTCCKYFHQDGTIDAEIQTELLEPNCTVKIPTKSSWQYKSKAVGTPNKTYVDTASGPNIEYKDYRKIELDVSEGIKNEEQIIELTGVTYDTFNFLLKRVEDTGNEKLTKKNKLLLFLIQLKSGMTSAAVSVFFNVHRSTVKKIFLSVLQNLTSKIHSEIIWPSKDVVIGSLPPRVLSDEDSTNAANDSSNPQADGSTNTVNDNSTPHSAESIETVDNNMNSQAGESTNTVDNNSNSQAEESASTVDINANPQAEESTSTATSSSTQQIQKISSIDDCVYFYSQCKEEFNAKISVAVSKTGFVSFKWDSPAKKDNNSQIDSESDPESSVDNKGNLSEKGFLELQLRINKDGKKAIVVLPRFSSLDSAHAEEQTQEKSKLPRVKVHVRRIIQRFKIFKLLDKIPDNLSKNLEDIMKVCCILINLQPIVLNERGPYSKNKSKGTQ